MFNNKYIHMIAYITMVISLQSSFKAATRCF